MLVERIWEDFDLSAISHIVTRGDTSLERFFLHKLAEQQIKFGLPTYREIEEIGAPERLWIESDDMEMDIVFQDGTIFRYCFDKGFMFDKASTPIGKNNIQESDFPARGHDVGCSCHYLEFLEEEGDKGFRANNRLFYYSMLWFIAVSEFQKLERVSGKFKWWKRFVIKASARHKRRRAKIWYVAVNSIVGQGFYETNKRDWHKKKTRFEVINP